VRGRGGGRPIYCFRHALFGKRKEGGGWKGSMMHGVPSSSIRMGLCGGNRDNEDYCHHTTVGGMTETAKAGGRKRLMPVAWDAQAAADRQWKGRVIALYQRHVGVRLGEKDKTKEESEMHRHEKNENLQISRLSTEATYCRPRG